MERDLFFLCIDVHGLFVEVNITFACHSQREYVQTAFRVNEGCVIPDRRCGVECPLNHQQQINRRLVGVLRRNSIVQSSCIKVVERIEKKITQSRAKIMLQPLFHGAR